jgi:hypothetical protein
MSSNLQCAVAPSPHLIQYQAMIQTDVLYDGHGTLLLLQDFFANSAEGAKARGEPPPNKPKTAEEQVRPRLTRRLLARR